MAYTRNIRIQNVRAMNTPPTIVSLCLLVLGFYLKPSGIFEFDVLAYLVAVTSLISFSPMAFLASMSAMER